MKTIKIYAVLACTSIVLLATNVTAQNSFKAQEKSNFSNPKHGLSPNKISANKLFLPKKTKLETWDKTNKLWIDQSNITNSYTSNGMLLVETTQSASFENLSKTIYTYTANNTLTQSYTFQVWRNSKWDDDFKTDYVYDANLNLLQSTTKTYNFTTSQLENESRNTSTYNNKNLETEYIAESYKNGAWVIDEKYKTDYTFSSNGENVKELLYSTFNKSLNIYEPSYKVLVNYVSGKLISDITGQEYNTTNMIWTNDIKRLFTYDNNGILKTLEEQRYNGTSFENDIFADSIKYAYYDKSKLLFIDDIDEVGNISYLVNKTWDGSKYVIDYKISNKYVNAPSEYQSRILNYFESKDNGKNYTIKTIESDIYDIDYININTIYERQEYDETEMKLIIRFSNKTAIKRDVNNAVTETISTRYNSDIDSFENDTRKTFSDFQVVGTNLNDKATLALYPNPAKDVINISNAIGTNATYIILDITGKVLETNKITGNAISVEALNAGIYIISIKDSNGIYTQKFNKQ